MANFKRKRRKSARAGCLLCKPHKANGCHAQNERRPQILRDRVERREAGVR